MMGAAAAWFVWQNFLRDQIDSNILLNFVNGLGRSNNDVSIDDIIRAIQTYDVKQFQDKDSKYE